MNEIYENDILTTQQKELLILFSQSQLSSAFYLSGGTALSACYLHHRLSEDLDFFSDQDISVEIILSFLKSIPAIKDISYERKYDRKIFLLQYQPEQILKIEFTMYPFERLAPASKFGGVMADSISDILANKLMAMTDRRDPKDYADVYFILQEYPSMKIENSIRQTENKFGIRGVSSILSGRFLEPPAITGLSLRKQCNDSDIKHFFQETARTLIRSSIGI